MSGRSRFRANQTGLSTERRDWFARRAARYAATLLALLMTTGCSLGRFHSLSENVNELSRLGAAHGHVHCAKCDFARLIVVALDVTNGPKISNYAVTSDDGFFLLRLEAGGTYLFSAFDDRNGNGSLDLDEPRTLLDRQIRLSETSPSVRVDLELSSSVSLPQAQSALLMDLARFERKPLPIGIGELTSLNDPQFDPTVARMGLWRPADFFGQVGGGVYLLAPFDKKKLPVIFVHGAGGSPREFGEIIEALAPGVQPILFYYPSGLRLASSSQMLSRLVLALHAKFKFERYAVIAHSMGGLVALSALTHYPSPLPGYSPQLITLASPWNGHAAAELGVRFAATPIPSWIDMQPGSEFQTALFRENELKRRAVNHHLLFAYRGNQGDGVVSLSSQLRGEAQEAAESISGYNETHASILRSQLVLAKIQNLLGLAARNER